MPCSFAEPVTLTCSRGHQYEAQAWRVIDLSEHPELVSEIMDGLIASPPCTECGSRGLFITQSLLLFLPGRHQPLVFSPIRMLSQEELRDELSQYISHLRHQ